MGFIRAYYEQFVTLKEAEWEFIASHFEAVHFDKNEIITPQGETEHRLLFIDSGIVRSFVPDIESELTFGFAFAKEFTCVYESFLTQTPSQYALQALTPVSGWQISYDAMQRVYSQTQVGNYLGRFASEQLYLSKSRREIYLLKHTIKERYLKLFEEQPQILKYIPLKYIASYIGTTPQGLSRIRREIN